MHSTTKYQLLLLISLLLGVISLSACETEQNPASAPLKIKAYEGSGPIQICCTVGMVSDIVQKVCGDRAEVQTLMGPGTDPHLYKASPSDVDALDKADAIFYGGHHLEGKLAGMLGRIAKRTPSLAVAEQLDQSKFLADESNPDAVDPHLWFDVSLWMESADVIASFMSKLDPSHADRYMKNAEAYKTELVELDKWTIAQLKLIAPESRVLITAHDAFRYFGKAYDFKVLGIQGLSTESEAGVSRINELVELIVQNKIKAVFVESTVSEKNIKSLIEGCAAKQHEVKIGGSLYSDAMGPKDSAGGTYPGMLRHNVSTIVGALK